MDIYGVGYQDAAQYVLGGRGRGGGGRTNAAEKSPLESVEYKEAKKIVEELNPEVLGRDLTAAEVDLQKKASAVLQAARETAFGLTTQNGNKNAHEPDVNNYYQAIDFATELFNRGATVEQAMSILRDKMGDGPMYRHGSEAGMPLISRQQNKKVNCLKIGDRQIQELVLLPVILAVMVIRFGI